MAPQLGVIHTVGSLRQSAGGPSRTVTALCRELGRLGMQVDLLSQDAAGAGADENLRPPVDLVTTTLASAYRLPYVGKPWSPSFRAMLRKCCHQSQGKLIHDNGIWLPTNHAAAMVARKVDIPLIVSTHGMLEPWSLSHRAWKKRLAWRLYQHRDLLTARVLHATAQQEADNLRWLGLRQPIAIIPNGVDLPAWSEDSKVQEVPRIALFLSRIHPIKGLLNLVDAWRVARPCGWRVIIAGPDEEGHRAVVEERIKAAGLAADFEFVGAVDGSDKTALYCRADLFVLPSFTENFGVVVAEALACGVPVITTKGTPWGGLVTHRCGWWVEIGSEPLIGALLEATSLPPAVIGEMGKRGRSYVEQHFGWPGIAREMLAVYRWVLGQAEKPPCILLD